MGRRMYIHVVIQKVKNRERKGWMKKKTDDIDVSK